MNVMHTKPSLQKPAINFAFQVVDGRQQALLASVKSVADASWVTVFLSPFKPTG